MAVVEQVQALALKIREQKLSIETEEATKNAFVMPFIGSVLGYDVFDPSEVIPEFTADVGTKKGEKIDYALVQDGKVQILIEVKKINEPLRVEHTSQLFRYFAVTQARIAVLTNGEVYEFYTDLDAPNRMDDKPFLVLDLAAIDDTVLHPLGKLTKESFDLDSVLSTAGELKYIGQIKRILASELKNPSEELVRFLAAQVYPGRSTQRVREQFASLVVKAASHFINEQVNDRLKTALGSTDADSSATSIPVVEHEQEQQQTLGAIVASPSQNNEIETTDEELEGYRIVRAIVCSEVAATRVIGRDAKTYFAVLLDDNNRKPIARLWFNRSNKYLGLLDENKSETRVAIESPVDIYKHAEYLRKTVDRYLGKQQETSVEPRTPSWPSPFAATNASAPTTPS